MARTEEKTELTLLSDQALLEGEADKDSDGLGFETYSRVLASAATGTPGPFTIGVFGEWGTGKTSLMRLIREDLEARDGVITVWFNAWRYEQEEHPIVPLVGTIVRELERHETFQKQLKDGGRLLLKALRAVAYGMSVSSKLEVPGIAAFGASIDGKDVIDQADHLTADPLLDRSQYHESFESLNALEFSEVTRIVILIDDLDRCLPDRAIALLESIKLVLAQPGFIFVLGVARSVIEGYLEHRYEKQYGLTNFEGRSYLDKIVQLPFHIPPHTGRVKDFSAKLLERVAPDLRTSLSEILPVVASASGGNPRTTIRFVNNLLIDMGINEQLFDEPIPIEYFAVSRCLQQRWPDVFSQLIRSNEVCVALAKWNDEWIRKQASSDGTGPGPSVVAALLADNDLSTLLKTEHGISWLREESTRSAAIHFLQSRRRENADDAEENTICFITPSDEVEHTHLISKIMDKAVGIRSDVLLIDDYKNINFDAQKSIVNDNKLICYCINDKNKSDILKFVSKNDITSDFIGIILPNCNGSFNEFFEHIRTFDLHEGINERNAAPFIYFVKSTWQKRVV